MYQPKITKLYKYREFNEFTLDIIVNNRIFFPKPLSFNDPFDCSIKVDHNLNLHDYLELLKKSLTKKKIPKSKVESKINEAKLLGEVPQRFSEEAEIILKGIERDNHEKGVVCLSEDNSNILMWSHYADDHKGICIEFERHKNNSLGSYQITRPIIYQEDYPKFTILDFFKSEERGILEQLMWTKSKDWKYEKEWRITTKNGNVLLRVPGDITAIIFGIKAPQSSIDIIRKLIQGTGITLKQAEKVDGKFKLIATKVI